MARIIDDNIKRQLSKRMDFFLKYFPVRVRNVGEDAVAARQLIWDFKDARDNAFEKVAQMTATHLIQVCGEKIKDIVFVCVPASTQAKNESRYKAFCNRVSDFAASSTAIRTFLFRVTDWRYTSTAMTWRKVSARRK